MSETLSEQQMGRREPTSMNIDSELWKEVRKTAIDKGITATEYFEQALREKLARDKHSTKEASKKQ